MADKEAARMDGTPIIISQAPDVCKTPMGPSTPPVPYPVTKTLGDAIKCSPNVNFTGQPAFILASMTPDVQGDAAGTAGGIKSGTVGGPCEPISGSSTCNVNGSPIIRHGDPFWMNNRNTVGKLVYVVGGGVAGTDAQTAPPEEEPGHWARIADGLQEAAEQTAGVVVGFSKAAGETVEFLGKVVQYQQDASALGFVVDGAAALIGATPPAWLPSHQQARQTEQAILETGQAIWDNPTLVWEGIKAPYVEAWAQGRYGEAIGRGIFDIGGLFVGAHGLDKAGKLGKLGALADKLGGIDDIADVLTVARRADTVIPEQFAGLADELLNLKRAKGALVDVVHAARQSDTLNDLLDLGKLTPEEIDKLAALGALTPEEAARARQALANAGDGVKVTREMTTAEKAAMGERVAHDKMVEKGYEPVGKTDGVYHDGQSGIDGVYANPHPPPDYIVIEAKFGSAQLERGLADGTNQMDDAWIQRRLVDKVGKAEAVKIRAAMNTGNVEKLLIRVAEDGSTTATKIDPNGFLIRGSAGRVPGF